MTSPTLNSVSFVVPLVPPSVNNYVRHTGRGGHYKTNEAVAFGKAMVILGQSHARAFGPFDAYRVEVTVHLKGRMGFASESHSAPEVHLSASKVTEGVLSE